MDVKSVVFNQAKIFNMLKQTKSQGRLSHAYLFYGDVGVGKKEMAYALACLLYCPNGGCLECDTCRSILDNNHLNVEYIGINDNKTMISKDQITSLQEDFAKTSLIEGTRVYIVDGIDTASLAAQNSLLKFIEDPLNQTPTVGIFLATDLANVVSTIQSRCNLLHFEAIEYTKRIELLEEASVDKLDAILSSRLTNNIDDAKQMVENKEYNNLKDIFLELLSLENEVSGVEFFLRNNSYVNDSKRISVLLEWVILFLEDCNYYVSGNEKLILTPLCDKIKLYSNKNKKYLRDRLKMALMLFDKLKYNISAKNIFHELIMKFI